MRLGDSAAAVMPSPDLIRGPSRGIQAAPSVIIPPTSALDAPVNPPDQVQGVHDGSGAKIFFAAKPKFRLRTEKFRLRNVFVSHVFG